MKIFLAILALSFSACTVSIPIGADAKYGVVGLTVSYQPPFPNVLAEQPNIGGFAK